MLTGGWTGSAVRALALAALAVSATATAEAMSCTASAEPRHLRYNGAAELLADVKLVCTGGRAPAPGEQPPLYQIVVSADAPLTLRTFGTNPDAPGRWTEALLLVDEPAPGEQRVCAPSAAVFEQTPESLDCGPNEGRANVFQGQRLQENAVVFRQTSIAPPGANGARTLRIVNLRADVSGITPPPAPKPPVPQPGVPPEPVLPVEPEPPPEVYLTVRIFGPGGAIVPVEMADQLVGTVLPGVEMDVRTASDQPVPDAEPALLTTPGLTPQGRPETGPTFLIRFKELSPRTFRRRNVGTNGLNPIFLTGQANPGVEFHTESGLFNPLFPNLRGLSQAGLADAGTRLRVVLEGVPPGVRVWFSFRDVETGTSGYDPDGPRARLTAPEGGSFRPQLPEIGDFIEVWPSNGRAEALWEVTASDPDAIETLAFAVGMTGPNNDVELGDAVIYGGFAPELIRPEDELDLRVDVIPAFDTADLEVKPRPAFSVVSTLPTSALTAVSAASYQGSTVAPGSIVAGFGSELSEVVLAAFGVPGPRLGTTRVDVIDSFGVLRPASLFAVSPTQVNFFLDPRTRLGPAIVTIYDDRRPLAEGLVQVVDAAPGLFSASGDGRGAPAGQLVTVAGGAEPLADLNPGSGEYQPRPLDLTGGDAYLVLYGTGIRRSPLSEVTVTVGGRPVPVLYAGEQPEFLGLDQINAGPLPRELVGRGAAEVRVTASGTVANSLTIFLQ